MNRRRKTILILISWVPVMVLACVSAIFVIGQYHRVMNNAGVVFEQELARRFGKEVRVGRARVSRPGLAILDNVRVANTKDLKAGSMIVVAQIRVHYSLVDLILGRRAQAVSLVEAIRPRLYLVRRADGSYNIKELLKKPPGPPGPPFIGKVRITGGEAEFKDYLAGGRKTPAVTRCGNVTADVDAKLVPSYSFVGSGVGEGGAFKNASVIGVYNSRAHTLHVNVNGDALSASYWSAYVKYPRNIPILAGRANVALGVDMTNLGRHARTHVTGAVTVAGAVARLPWFSEPASDISGSASLLRDSVFLSLRGAIARSRVVLRGEAYDFANPKLDFTVTSTSMDFASLLRISPFPAVARQATVTGPGPASARITGPAFDPTIAATATIPSVTVDGYTAKGVTGSGVYHARSIDLRPLRFGLLGASVSASGTVSVGPSPSLSMRGRFLGLQLSSLLGPQNQIAGTMNGDFTVTGTVASPVIVASGVAGQGSAGGTPFQMATANMKITGGTARLTSLDVRKIAGGSIAASGRASMKEVSLDVKAEGIDLSVLGSLMKQPGLSGIGYFTGRVTGSVAKPSVGGTLEVFKGQYQGYAADYMRVVFAGNRQSVDIEEGILRLFPAEFKFSGSVTGVGTSGIGIEGDATVERLTVERLSKLLGVDIQGSGILIGSLRVSGLYRPTANSIAGQFGGLAASGNVRLEDGTVLGYPIDTATGSVQLASDVVKIGDAVVVSRDARAKLSGSADIKTKSVDVSLDLTGFDLARVSDRLKDYVTVGGVASGSGGITGPWANPRIAVSGSVDKLSIDAKRFDKADLTAEYADSVLTAAKLTLSRGAQVLTVKAKNLNLKTNNLGSAAVAVNAASVPDFWDMLVNSPFLATDEGQSLRAALDRVPRFTSGSVDAEFQVGGRLDNPEGSLKLVARDVGADVQKIDSISVDASMADGALSLNELKAVSEDMIVTAVGKPVLKDDKLQLDLSAQNVDLSRLRPWLGENTPGGVATADFVVTGDLASPAITGSVEVAGPSFRGIVFDRLRAGAIRFTGDKVEISDVILASGSHEAYVKGYVPWDWSEFTIPASKPMELTFELKKTDLSVFGALTSELDISRTSGSVQGNVQVAGTIAAPQIVGGIQVADGVVGLKGFGNQFNSLNADLEFKGRSLEVRRLTAESNLGGAVSVQPGSYIELGQLTKSKINLLIAADRLTIGEKNLFGYQEDVNLRVDAGLSVTGTLSNPTVADADVGGKKGGVLISNSRVSFAVPQNTKEHVYPVFPVNPVLNVHIRVGDNVTVSPPSMTLLLTGDGTLTGMLSKPDMSLTFDVQQGNMRLTASRLRILPGGRITVHYAPPAPPDLRVDFQALTTALATSPFGQRQQYEITVSVTGTVTDMKIGLSSNPADLTREQMLAALGHVPGIFTSGETEMQRDLGTVLSAVGASTVFAPIENLLVERLGFEQFSLQYNAAAPLSLFLSRKLVGNFYVSYYQLLTSSLANVNDRLFEVKLSYRLKRAYAFSISVDDQQTTTGLFEFTRSFR